MKKATIIILSLIFLSSAFAFAAQETTIIASDAPEVKNNIEKKGSTSFSFTEWTKSLLFNANENDLISEALKSYDVNRYKDDDSKVASPTIYLATLGYVNKDDWFVWINGKKITNKNPTEIVYEDGSLTAKISSISADTVILEAKVSNASTAGISSGLMGKLTHKNEDGNVFANSDGSITYNSQTNILNLELKVNQSFVVLLMEVHEGKY